MLGDGPLRRILRILQGSLTPAKSLYLPASPYPKFPPRTLPPLPSDLLLNLACEIGPQTIFSFKFEEDAGYPDSIDSFNDVISEMRKDRAFIIKRSCILTIDSESRVSHEFRLEYRFSQPLIERTYSSSTHSNDPKLSPFDYLFDLTAQLASHRRSIKIHTDELGANWLRLRDANPYREHCCFRNVTVHIHYIGDLIGIVYGESDEDIDTGYQYEWMIPIVKEYLDRKIANPT